MKVWSAAVGRFRTRAWDGEMVVYDESSGDTHSLDPLATALLIILQENGAATVADLSGVAAAQLEEDEKLEPEAVVTEALEVLQTLRLVECAER